MSIFPTSKKIIEILVIHANSIDDERLRDKFDRFVNSWKLQRPEINIKYQNQILARNNSKQDICKHLNKANIILLLESPDFWNQENCRNFTRSAMARYNVNKSRVIPIKFRPTGLQVPPFGIGDLYYLPTNREPVVSKSWGRQDNAFNDIVENLDKVVEELEEELEEEQRQIQLLRQQQKAEFFAFIRELINKIYSKKVLRSTKSSTRSIIIMAGVLVMVICLVTWVRPSSEQQINNLLTQGINEYEKREYQGAIKIFTKVIKIDDKNIYAYISRGNSYYQLKQYQAAIENYKKVISLNPNSIDAAEAYQNLGQVHFLLGKKQPAINYYQMAAAIYKEKQKKDTYKQVIDIIWKIQRSQRGSV